MGKTDRTEIINILDWLEEDAKQELRKEERADYLKLKTRMVKLKTDAILEMYHSIQESKDDRDKCLEALGKVHLCYRLTEPLTFEVFGIRLVFQATTGLLMSVHKVMSTC